MEMLIFYILYVLSGFVSWVWGLTHDGCDIQVKDLPMLISLSCIFGFILPLLLCIIFGIRYFFKNILKLDFEKIKNIVIFKGRE